MADYFHMVRLELAGQPYNKAAHNRGLQSRLHARSRSAIEMKHQNISAVLQDLGHWWLRGYQPLPNYQRALFEAVEAHLTSDRLFDQAAISLANQPADVPLELAFKDFVVSAPLPSKPRINDERLDWARKSVFKRDYFEQEARNRTLGLAGEKLVLEYETQRLQRDGRADLARKIEHVSIERGDGLGYDILSFDSDGRERFIEVKTTAFVAATPFFISQNEVRFSREFSDRFQLYRLFDFREMPRMFTLPGSVEGNCRLDPQTYRASIL